MAHTNGVESFWSLLKRGYVGPYQKDDRQASATACQWFAGLHNQRPMDTEKYMGLMMREASGKRLQYRDLVK